MATHTITAQPTIRTESAAGAERTSIYRWAAVYARVALGCAFLSSVGDRFGLFGPIGKPNVSWGDFHHFTVYTGMVNSFLPAGVIPAVAWAATVLETIFGVGLILGIYKRVMALGSAVLLLMFALGMTISFGVRSALDYSVYSASSAALLLFLLSSNHAPVKR